MEVSPVQHDTSTDSERPLLTLVVPMFNVAAYLPDFLRSIEMQGAALQDAEIIFVDDGSTDESGAIARAWCATVGVRTHVHTKENGGLSSARNAGMELATGDWVSFPDPDDMLSAGYLATVTGVMRSRDVDGVPTIATNIVYYYEASRRYQDTHPLRGPFSEGRRIVWFDDEPQAVKLQAATTFFRLDRIRANALAFDGRIRPNFEDAAFQIRYQSTMARPGMVVVPDAVYHYRRRADESSLVASSWTKPEKYTAVPRYGWLASLRAARVDGHVPRWVQYIVLYDLHWYFVYDTQIHTPTKGIPADIKAEFISTLKEVLALIDPETIIAYEVTGLSRLIRFALVSLAGAKVPVVPVDVVKLDAQASAVQLRYFYNGDAPREVFRDEAGAEIVPVTTKTRVIHYFDHTMLKERIIWLPTSRSISVWRDGVRADVHFGQGRTPSWLITRKRARAALGSTAATTPASLGVSVTTPGRVVRATAARVRHTIEVRGEQIRRILQGRTVKARRPIDVVINYMSRLSSVRKKFSGAWVLMDRDVQAQDNAEHLYRWIAQHRPEVNAWFVLSKSSPDWQRLREEGFRLVNHGSTQHLLLLLNAKHLISSHIDHYVVNPYDRRRFGRAPWRYTFLQHGVTINDISRWINAKPIDLMITASPREQEWLAGDETPFTLTNKECRLTGFPRHDALLEKARSVPESERNLIVVMPTWREYLMHEATGRGNLRDLADGFRESSYFRTWMAFLGDARLATAARRMGKRIVFVPHPNLEAHLTHADVPEGVSLRRYADGDIQETIARAAVLISDYSSLTFEAGLLLVPVIYFQFDKDEFYARHPHRPGYFVPERDGFGPVVYSEGDAVRETIAFITSGGYVGSEFEARARAAYAYRDDQSCRRTFEAIVELTESPAEERNTEARSTEASTAEA